jgi:hypothetical protein
MGGSVRWRFCLPEEEEGEVEEGDEEEDVLIGIVPSY